MTARPRRKRKSAPAAREPLPSPESIDDDAQAKWVADVEAKLHAGHQAATYPAKFAAKQLDEYTRRFKNTSLLIGYLRRAADSKIKPAPLDPLLAKLIADTLDDSLRAKNKGFTAWDRGWLQGQVDTVRKELEAGNAHVLKRVGLTFPPSTKGELTKFAKKIVAKELGLSPRSLSDRLHPKGNRGKRG